MSTTNNNQALIDALRQAADWLESKPAFPAMGSQALRIWVWQDRAKLKDIARQLGAFAKKYTGTYFELHKSISEALTIEVVADREMVCKKVVTWECPDDDSLLRFVDDGPEEVEGA